MEYWLLIPGFTAGCIIGFAAGYWFQQPEIDKARRECRHKEIALDELRKEIKKTTKSTAFMKRWARGVR